MTTRLLLVRAVVRRCRRRANRRRSGHDQGGPRQGRRHRRRRHGHRRADRGRAGIRTRPSGPDGAGYLIVYAAGGTYDLRPGSTRRITTGQLLAMGPTGWLTLECDDQLRCFTMAVDRNTWTHRVLGPMISTSGPRASSRQTAEPRPSQTTPPGASRSRNRRSHRAPKPPNTEPIQPTSRQTASVDQGSGANDLAWATSPLAVPRSTRRPLSKRPRRRFDQLQPNSGSLVDSQAPDFEPGFLKLPGSVECGRRSRPRWPP